MSIKVLIKDRQNNVKSSPVFPSQGLAEAWVAGESEKGSFGKIERWVIEGFEDVSGSLEQREVEGVTEHRLPAEFVVEYVDISAQVAAANAVEARKKKRNFGESMVDEIGAMNEGKGLTAAQTDAFMSDPLIASLREHLWAGNIPSFVEKLEASDVSAYFSSVEKSAVIAKCNAFLASL